MRGSSSVFLRDRGIATGPFGGGVPNVPMNNPLAYVLQKCHRDYDAAFKARALGHFFEDDSVSVTDVAVKFEVPISTVRLWLDDDPRWFKSVS